MIIRRAFIISLSLLIFHSSVLGNGDSWKEIIEEGEGFLEVYWYPNNVIIENSLDVIDGIEHDLAVSFIQYVNKKYEVSVELKWIESQSFQNVIESVKGSRNGTFGAASISITDDRSKYLNFTTPYMADVAVLVSNNYLPVALTEDELRRILSGNKAVTIQNTTLDRALKDLKSKLKLDFEIAYVSNSGSIIDEIVSKPKSFGYVDIANFLDAIDQNIEVKRQFFYPIKLQGLAFAYPKGSDWQEPIEDYFNSQQFNLDKFRIITKYLGSDASEIISRISKSAEIGPLEEIVISNREKEAQYERLLEAFRRDQENARINTILISILVVVLILIVLLLLLYRLKALNNEKLVHQQTLIEQRNKQLKYLNEEKNDLIQVLAHDLRSPLGNIQNGSQIIEERETLSDDGKKLLGFIIQSSKNMTALIAKILDVNAIESGKHNLKYEAFDIGLLIKKVVEDNKSKATNKSIRLMIDEIGNQEVNADKVYTSQIMDNLISNAIKYSNEGSEVSISTSFDKNKVKISVADEGPGLTKEDESKIFQKYQRLSARPTKGETSTGLGLSIVKAFAEKMGGSVSFDTKLGYGTTFHVFLQKAN